MEINRDKVFSKQNKSSVFALSKANRGKYSCFTNIYLFERELFVFERNEDKLVDIHFAVLRILDEMLINSDIYEAKAKRSFVVESKTLQN